MSTWDTIRGWFGFAPLAESIMIDSDDYLYRPLTSRATSDLPQHQHDRMLKIAAHLDRSNPVAKRIMDLLTDFVFAEGVQITCRNAEVEKLLRDHWDDPVNDWDARGPRMFRLRLRDGEIVMPAGVNEVDGAVRWGMIPSRMVKEVRPDPLNWEIVRSVILMPETTEREGRNLAVINEQPESGRLEGECVFLKINDDGLRGISMLYPLADFLDSLNTMAFSEVDRAQMVRAFVWDVTINGATPDDLKGYAQDPNYSAPRPGSARIHNENVTYQALAPQLNSYDATELMGWVLNTLILGSVGVPEHWFGSGGDVNRAVGAVMETPTIKMLSRLQRDWQQVMSDVLRYVVDQAVIHGALPAQVAVENADGKRTGEMIDPRLAFEVVAPDMDTTDMTQLAATVVQVTQALVIAEQQEYTSKATARAIFSAIAQQLGPDIDPDEEAERIANQTEQREKEGDVPERVANEIERAMANGKRDKERVA